eukprot:2711885-Amphidinium_carterae.1
MTSLPLHSSSCSSGQLAVSLVLYIDVLDEPWKEQQSPSSSLSSCELTNSSHHLIRIPSCLVVCCCAPVSQFMTVSHNQEER